MSHLFPHLATVWWASGVPLGMLRTRGVSAVAAWSVFMLQQDFSRKCRWPECPGCLPPTFCEVDFWLFVSGAAVGEPAHAALLAAKAIVLFLPLPWWTQGVELPLQFVKVDAEGPWWGRNWASHFIGAGREAWGSWMMYMHCWMLCTPGHRPSTGG